MIRVSGLLIEDMRTAVCIRFCVAAKEEGAGGSAGKREQAREGTKRQRVAPRQDASGIEWEGKRRRRERAGDGEGGK